MTKSKKIHTWRLPTLPSPDEIVNLVKAGIITEQEAREFIFTEEDVEG